MTGGLEGHRLEGDPYLPHGLVLKPLPGGEDMRTMNLRKQDTGVGHHHSQTSVGAEHMEETEGIEAQGVVIEQDPSHRQIPLAHDLPEEPAKDVQLHHPLVVAALHQWQGMNIVGVDRHQYQGHVLVP